MGLRDDSARRGICAGRWRGTEGRGDAHEGDGREEGACEVAAHGCGGDVAHAREPGEVRGGGGVVFGHPGDGEEGLERRDAGADDQRVQAEKFLRGASATSGYAPRQVTLYE